MPEKGPEMPAWFKPLFFTQFILNIAFIIWASLYMYIGLSRIEEFWAVDSRNMWVEIRSIRREVNNHHEERGKRDGSGR